MKVNPFEEKIIDLKPVSNSIKEIKKGDIFDTICNQSSNPISTTKTAAQIKEQIAEVLMPESLSKLEVIKNQMMDILPSCGGAPINKVRSYKINLDEINFREYNYNETRFYPENLSSTDNNKQTSIYKEFIPEVISEEIDDGECETDINIFNWPISEDQAQVRCKYNELLREFVEIFTDIKTLIALNQIQDNQSYYLSINQIIALKFSN